MITTSPGPARALGAESTVSGAWACLSQAARLWEIVMLVIDFGVELRTETVNVRNEIDRMNGVYQRRMYTQFRAF